MPLGDRNGQHVRRRVNHRDGPRAGVCSIDLAALRAHYHPAGLVADRDCCGHDIRRHVNNYTVPKKLAM
jgi:hypothetical protein